MFQSLVRLFVHLRFSGRSSVPNHRLVTPAQMIDPIVHPRSLRVLIVAEHASKQFGGEAILPLHYFRVLRQRGIEAWLVVHERTRSELLASFPQDSDRIYFTADTAMHRMLFSAHPYLPRKVFEITLGFAMGLLTQMHQRRLIKQLVKRQRIDIVHQPICVSPKTPSLIFGVGAPVVMGPMNGGMTYPPGFRHMERRWVALSVALGRFSASLLNFLIPGKRLAATLLVANSRTREALPAGVRGKVIELAENGVELPLWQSRLQQASEEASVPRATRFVFMGRLVDWKGVDLLLKAFSQVLEQVPAELEIVGDGVDRSELERQAGRLGLVDRVKFLGWLPQTECAQQLAAADALVLPSLFESGGAVVLEAMTMGLPVIATAWGGPTQYLDPWCGILVPPTDPASFVQGLADAMVKLAQSPELRQQMGQVGRQRVLDRFDWDKKVDAMLQIYAETIGRDRQQSIRDAERRSSLSPV